jgi:hypothetical protein
VINVVTSRSADAIGPGTGLSNTGAPTVIARPGSVTGGTRNGNARTARTSFRNTSVT